MSGRKAYEHAYEGESVWWSGRHWWCRGISLEWLRNLGVKGGLLVRLARACMFVAYVACTICVILIYVVAFAVQCSEWQIGGSICHRGPQ